MESPAQASAPKNVASAGFTSRKPKRTMRIETSTATTENTAQIARPCREAGHGLRLVGSGKPAGHRSKICRVGALPGKMALGRTTGPFETTDLAANSLRADWG